MSEEKTARYDTVGSIWRRWDPHIHSPGTSFADRFGGDVSWDDYIKRVETVLPRIEALGVTDYFRLDGYKKVCEQKVAGRLGDVGLIFPNVELRYAIGSPKGALPSCLRFLAWVQVGP